MLSDMMFLIFKISNTNWNIKKERGVSFEVLAVVATITKSMI